MTRTISAHFDGEVIVPDEPVDLPVGQCLKLQVEIEDLDSSAPFSNLLELEADLPDAPNDLAAEHDHYLYGTDKR